MEKNVSKRKSPSVSVRAGSTFSGKKKETTVTLLFTSCPTCFNFLKIPIILGDNKASGPVEKPKP